MSSGRDSQTDRRGLSRDGLIARGNPKATRCYKAGICLWRRSRRAMIVRCNAGTVSVDVRGDVSSTPEERIPRPEFSVPGTSFASFSCPKVVSAKSGCQDAMARKAGRIDRGCYRGSSEFNCLSLDRGLECTTSLQPGRY